MAFLQQGLGAGPNHNLEPKTEFFMEQINVDIPPDGGVKIDAVGFSGPHFDPPPKSPVIDWTRFQKMHSGISTGHSA